MTEPAFTELAQLFARMQEPASQAAVSSWLASPDLALDPTSASAETTRVGRIVVIGGTNGAGKSSVAGARLRRAGGAYFNPDEAVANAIARSAGGDRRAIAAAVSATARERLERAITRGEEYVFEATLAGESIVRLLERAIASGCSVHIRYLMLTSADLHVARVAARVRAGGHRVPEHRIRERFVVSARNLARLEARVASVAIFDNSKDSFDGSAATAIPTLVRAKGLPNAGRGDLLRHPLVQHPDRDAEQDGRLRCYRCGAPARWHPRGDVWVPACAEHAPGDDWT